MTFAISITTLLSGLVLVTIAQLLAKWRMVILFENHAGQSWSAYLWGALSDPYLWGVAGCICFGSAMWYISMARLPIGFMMASTALITPIVAIGGWYFHGEILNWTIGLGLLLVLSGVLLISSQIN